MDTCVDTEQTRQYCQSGQVLLAVACVHLLGQSSVTVTVTVTVMVIVVFSQASLMICDLPCPLCIAARFQVTREPSQASPQPSLIIGHHEVLLPVHSLEFDLICRAGPYGAPVLLLAVACRLHVSPMGLLECRGCRVPALHCLTGCLARFPRGAGNRAVMGSPRAVSFWL